MEKMKGLYEKVAGDSALQAKFNQIMEEAQEAGKDATLEKLVAFSKEQGFDVGAEEIAKFFKELAEKANAGELSESELDGVAGGKAGGFDEWHPGGGGPGYPGQPIGSNYKAVISTCQPGFGGFWL